METKTIGVIGGMGPEATVYCYQRIIAHTPAACDQEHLHVIIDSNARIPDRTEAIRRNGNEAREALAASALRLQRAGADFLIMPCNTAHYYYPFLVQRVALPFLNIIDEVIGNVRTRGFRRVGLLATTGTAELGLYQKQASGMEILIPEPEEQALVHQGILKIKARQYGEACPGLQSAGQSLIRRGAEALILACTDLPLVLTPQQFTVPVLDSVDILARAAVALARCQTEEGWTAKHSAAVQNALDF
jgi:aspartate racemase